LPGQALFLQRDVLVCTGVALLRWQAIVWRAAKRRPKFLILEQFAERLIQVLDRLGPRSVEVAIGVGLEILPGAFGLFSRLWPDRNQ
jgi:hypothetical protein